MSVVLSQVLRAHAELASGQPPQLPKAPSYGRYTTWLQQQDLSESEQFWRKLLVGCAGSRHLSIPPPPDPMQGFGQAEVELAAQTGDMLVRRGRGIGVTQTTLLMAAWACLLSRRAGTDDVVFGMVSSGRELDLEGIDHIVGMLATTLPLRVSTGRVGHVNAWLRLVQERSAAARDHGIVSLSQITRWSELASGRTLFDTLFVMSNYRDIDRSVQQPLRAELAEFRTVPAYPISVIVSPGRKLAIRLVYDRRYFDARAMSQVAAEYADLLDCLAKGQDPRGPV